MRPTWAEVSLGALRRNFAAIRERVGKAVEICAVIKADAYGHGAVECGRALASEGARWFGVSSTDEGIELREGGIEGRILLMTGLWRGEEDDILRHRLTPAIWEWWQAGGLESALRRNPGAPRPFPIHLKLDTGMARMGVPEYWHAMFLNRLLAASDLQIEGVFTQLASADVLGAGDVERQAQLFDDFIAKLYDRSIAPKYLHMANTATIASRPRLFHNMVRPGIGLYGYQLPFEQGSESLGDGDGAVTLPIEPVLSWKTRILSVRYVPSGRGVGYNATYTTQGPSQIAVLPLGYGDGLSRHLSWQENRMPHSGEVLVRGQRAPIVGRVSMDLTLADVTRIKGATVGDEVTILGRDGGERIDAWEHARLADTIPYEILCQIGKRVPRRYVD